MKYSVILFIILINLLYFERFKIYENVLHIFKLNKVNLIIRFKDVEYIIFTEDDLKNIFKNSINN